MKSASLESTSPSVKTMGCSLIMQDNLVVD